MHCNKPNITYLLVPGPRVSSWLQICLSYWGCNFETWQVIFELERRLSFDKQLCIITNMLFNLDCARVQGDRKDMMASPEMVKIRTRAPSLHWRHNECDGISNHRRLDCLLNLLFGRRSKKTSKLRVTGICEGNSPVTINLKCMMSEICKSVAVIRMTCKLGRVHKVQITTETTQLHTWLCHVVIFKEI